MKASVIIPAFNAADFIDVALSSCSGQTLGDIEIIVIDDRSSDSTAEIVTRLAGADSRIKLLENSGPKGPSAARNLGISTARGEWIAILDADDSFAPNRLETLIGEAEKRNLQVLADNIDVVDFINKSSYGKAFPDNWMNTGDLVTTDLFIERDTPGRIYQRPLGFIKPIFKRYFVISNNIQYAEDISMAEDLLFYIDLLLQNARFGLIDQTLYFYSSRQNSLSFDGDRTDDIFEVNRRIEERVRRQLQVASSAVSPRTAKLLALREQSMLYLYFSKARKSGQHKLAMQWALRMNPLFLSLELSKAFTGFRRR